MTHPVIEISVVLNCSQCRWFYKELPHREKHHQRLRAVPTSRARACQALRPRWPPREGVALHWRPDQPGRRRTDLLPRRSEALLDDRLQAGLRQSELHSTSQYKKRTVAGCSPLPLQILSWQFLYQYVKQMSHRNAIDASGDFISWWRDSF